MTFRLLLAMLLAFALLPSTATAQLSSGPFVGTQIEDFALRDQSGKQQKLSDLVADGPIALVVVRSLGWCSFCKEQIVHLQSELKSIKASGIRVVGLSFDSAEVLKDFASLKGIEFPLLSDRESRVIEQLGILNTTRKKGTFRYRVAHPLTILINSDRTVAGVVKSNARTTLHNSKQLLNAWSSIKAANPQKKMSFISVSKNRFVDEAGKQVIFKGLAISDPVKIVNDGHWNKKHFETIKSWGANLIRIPVHPLRVRKLGLEDYLLMLDEAVRWCNELEIYVIIDWHSIGNLRAEKFESATYKTNLEETLHFWHVVSERFAGNPTIAFYEVYNEPSTNFGEFGKCTWPQWKSIVEQCIDVIYAADRNVIPLVAGFDWAYDLSEVRNAPIERPGIAYVAHPYPGKSPPPREAHWEEHFGFVADRFPVIVSEMGYYLEGKYQHFVDDKNGTFRNAIIRYLDKKKISWCAWVFDPDWSPALIKNYKYEPTHSGAFFSNAMRSK